MTQGRQPRASVWALSTPLVVAGHALGLLQAPDDAVEEAAVLLEKIADRCRVDAEHLVNPAKRLALDLDGALPVVWGTSPLAAVAAYRFACQLNENAHVPAVHGALPEAGHNQVVALDGPMAARVEASATPTTSSATATTTSSGRACWRWCCCATPRSTRSRRCVPTSVELARERQAPVARAAGRGRQPFARLASLVAVPTSPAPTSRCCRAPTRRRSTPSTPSRPGPGSRRPAGAGRGAAAEHTRCYDRGPGGARVLRPVPDLRAALPVPERTRGARPRRPLHDVGRQAAAPPRAAGGAGAAADVEALRLP